MTCSEKVEGILKADNLLERIASDIEMLGVAGERKNALAVYLVGTSRLLSKPLAAIIQGPSSSGKSYLVEKVASMFPPEDVINATQITPQALFYMEPGSLSHKFVVAGERSRKEDDDTAEASRALREMISSGKLTKLVPIRKGNRNVTEVIEQDGPIAYIESTTLSKVFEEDANRCIMLHTDERRQQTKRIIESIAAGYSNVASIDKSAVVERHHELQRQLKPWPIIIPFAEKLAELFGSERVEARRAFPQLMSTIQAVCLLHQHQRQMTSDGVLDATKDDYEVARHILTGPLSRLLGGSISPPAKRFYDRLIGVHVAGDQFTTTEAARTETATRRAVSGWLAELADVEAIEIVEHAKGPRPAQWRLVADDINFETDCLELPTAEDVFS